MSSENYAAVLYGANDLRVEKWPMPIIKDDELLIRMEAVGICGSDVKFYSTGKFGLDVITEPTIIGHEGAGVVVKYILELLIRVEAVGICGSDVKFFTTGKCAFDVITEPTVIGHEGAGVVVKVGANVTTHKIGDRVAIEPTNPCRICTHCKTGRYHLCPKPRYCSTLEAPGNLSMYYAHVADFCHKIPDNLSMEEAAAVQPLAIAIHACNRARIVLGDKVAILGGGPIGVLSLMAAKSMGATSVLVTDVVKSRLETAKQLGADYTLHITPKMSEDETVSSIKELLGSEPDITIDACAFPSVQRVAMQVTRSGGRVVIVGIGGDRVEVPLSPTMLREVDIIGSFRFNNEYPAALAAVASGAINLKSFITDHYPLKDVKKAIEFAKTGAGMKVIIHTQK